ncbi:N-acetylmuramoyl-L-alanine amidase family protein [Heliorestis convoluta]|uniref:N-acetylmuramoyl-L-alanine amidase family protein n=1 Tax=Heliorestis convoluta TaxID=356322 RepID=A0A5Q2MX56_9FIRM|nr:N-acetylmuramoyl-L-alanine amidase [Heliorestis convoluta]QGG47148.1 N-acetylmuramoyl-L-alanine amidase family protein [Heliorestis convoluta]
MYWFFVRRKMLLLFSFFVLILLGFMTYWFLGLPLSSGKREAPPSAISPLQGKTILVDVGHGGVDGGASKGDSFLEKDMNLQMALQLQKTLQQHGAITFLSRDSDRDLSGVNPNDRRRNTLDLTNRIRWANQVGGDIFLSLHMNSSQSSRVRGALLLYYKHVKENSDAERLARHLQRELNYFYSAYAHKGEIYKHEPIKGNYFVLKHTKMPAVIVEMGFVTNAEDRKIFQQESFQEEFCEAIVKGLIKYFSQVPDQFIPSERPGME